MKKEIFKFLIHIIGWFIIGYIFLHLGDNTFLKNTLSNIMVIVAVVLYLFPSVEKSMVKETKKESSDRAKDLYSWTDNLDGGDNYLEYIFKSIESNSIPSNLIALYEKLINETENNFKKVRLLRAYYKAYKDRQAAKLYYKFMGTALFGFVIFSIQAILQGRITNESFLTFFNPGNAWGFILSLILIAVYYILLPHRKENRINLIINVLDEMIEIEENNEKKTILYD